MEWIIAIWNKINKPLHFLFVGAALVMFAPPGLNWTGYAFAAVGLAGSFEWGALQIHKWWEQCKQINNLRQSVAMLNADEKSLLQEQIQKGEQTFYLHPIRSGGITNYLRLANLYQGLAEKGIVNCTYLADGKTASIHITPKRGVCLSKNLEISETDAGRGG